MPFSVILPTCLMASPPIALNSKPKTIHWKVMRKGETKGRAEFSYCYATSDDFRGLPADVYQKAQITKTVYHHGKGCLSARKLSRDYEFSVYIPSSLDSNVSTIFAQWHGMPDRTLVQTPQGEVKKLTVDEFVELEKNDLLQKECRTRKSGQTG